tara:strand:+ start:43 stop:168 length:126 start_codon:yes stop_codon:yes gene_type:complete
MRFLKENKVILSGLLLLTIDLVYPNTYALVLGIVLIVKGLD